MAKKTEIVYACPFCRSSLWFNSSNGLGAHIFKHHLKDALDALARANKRKVSKIAQKWGIV